MNSTQYKFRCVRCGREIDSSNIIFRCPFCKGLLVIEYEKPVFMIDKDKPGIWRYRSLLPNFKEIISRGEGYTPIKRVGGVYIKNEKINPTGSYVDRASALIASYISNFRVRDVVVEYEEVFSKSLAYYLSNLTNIRFCIENEDLTNIPINDLVYLMKIGEIEICGDKHIENTLVLNYANPLTIEGLKTIVFELYEKKINVDYIVVPAKTGILAYSLAKGINDLEKSGLNIGYEIIATLPKNNPIPEILRETRKIKVVEVPHREILESLKELVNHGINTPPLSATAYYVAKNMSRAIAVITAGYKPTAKIYRDKGLKKIILETIKRRGPMTAYEIWKENQKYSLRGIYKSIHSLIEQGYICFETQTKRGRKVRVYDICS